MNLRKAKQIYMQRSEEHDKAKYMAVKAEEEQQSTASGITTKTLDKKRRLEEEAKNKVGTRQLGLTLSQHRSTSGTAPGRPEEQGPSAERCSCSPCSPRP